MGGKCLRGDLLLRVGHLRDLRTRCVDVRVRRLPDGGRHLMPDDLRRGPARRGAVAPSAPGFPVGRRRPVVWTPDLWCPVRRTVHRRLGGGQRRPGQRSFRPLAVPAGSGYRLVLVRGGPGLGRATALVPGVDADPLGGQDQLRPLPVPLAHLPAGDAHSGRPPDPRRSRGRGQQPGLDAPGPYLRRGGGKFLSGRTTGDETAIPVR